MRLGRRTVLRGIAAGTACTVGLPLLDAMLDSHGTALADGTELPKRFGLFFWANGTPWHGGHDAAHAMYEDKWTPAIVGPGWAPSPLLEPLRGIEHKLNVVSGFEPHTEWTDSPEGQTDGHMRGAAVALTSDQIKPDGFNQPGHRVPFSRASIDQVIARDPAFAGASVLGTVPRFRTLELGVSSARFHDWGHWNAISHSEPDTWNQPIGSAQALFSHLFGMPTDVAALGRRASVLDAVRADGATLRRRLGARDRDRLDAHLEHIGEIERRLVTVSSACTTPEAPAPYSSDLIVELEAQARVLAVALQCDLTRVFTMMFTSPATVQPFYAVGVGGGMHQLCHDGAYDEIYRITEYQMRALRAFLDVLDGTPDGEGTTLLDSMLVFATSEYGEGKTHGNKEHPVLLAGGARGAIATGIHARSPGDNLAKVHVTMMRALGMDTPSYGFSGSQTSEAIPGLLVG
jgi:hypothetical protein